MTDSPMASLGMVCGARTWSCWKGEKASGPSVLPSSPAWQVVPVPTVRIFVLHQFSIVDSYLDTRLVQVLPVLVNSHRLTRSKTPWGIRIA